MGMSDSSKPDAEVQADPLDAEVVEEGPIAKYMREHEAEFWRLVAFSMTRALIDDDDPSAVFGKGGATMSIAVAPLAQVMLEADYRIYVDEQRQVIRVNIQAPMSEMQPLIVTPADVLPPGKGGLTVQ